MREDDPITREQHHPEFRLASSLPAKGSTPDTLFSKVEIVLTWAPAEYQEAARKALAEIEQKFLSALDENERLRETVAAIQQNALAWHAGEDGKARSLNVIVQWASMALSGGIHPDVVKITNATVGGKG